MGSWGNTYPLAGDIHFDDSVEAWAGLASRGIFMMGRLGLLTINSADGCSFKAQPIWTKSRYKLQLMEPVKGGSCVNIGRPGSLWTSAKHAPGKDNAQFMIFEKTICCAGCPRHDRALPLPRSTSGRSLVCPPQSPDCPVCCAEERRRLPRRRRSTLVSTAPNVPRSASDPLPLASPVAVLTRRTGRLPHHRQLYARLSRGHAVSPRKGRRDVTGGVRW
jgi:hypothetical protein